jgi:hypothetical protein
VYSGEWNGLKNFLKNDVYALPTTKQKKIPGNEILYLNLYGPVTAW